MTDETKAVLATVATDDLIHELRDRTPGLFVAMWRVTSERQAKYVFHFVEFDTDSRRAETAIGMARWCTEVLEAYKERFPDFQIPGPVPPDPSE